jgi:DNA-binding transcriptional LysR family regulator
MDAQKLTYFLAAATTENFRKAAQICHVTQPVLSRQIAALEVELDVKLFHRENKRVTLTHAGREFERYARAIMDQMRQGQQAMHALRTNMAGAIRIGCIEPLAATLLPPAVAAFHQQHPRMQTSITVRGTEELFAAIENGELDLGLCGLPEERKQTHDLLTIEVLYHDPFVLALACNQPLALAGQPMHLAEIAPLPLVLLTANFATRHIIERAFAERAIIPPEPLLEIDNVVALKKIVQHGVGATILPRSLFTAEDTHSITTLPISDLQKTLAFAIVYQRIGELAPAVHAFIHTLTSSIENRK